MPCAVQCVSLPGRSFQDRLPLLPQSWFPSSWAIYRVSAANAVKFRVLRACVWCPLLVGPHMGQDVGIILAFEWWKLYWEELNINISKKAGFPCSVFFLREIYKKSGEQRELRTEEGRLDYDRHRCEEACSVFPRSLARLYLPLYLPFFWAHLFLQWPSLRKTQHIFRKKKKYAVGTFCPQTWRTPIFTLLSTFLPITLCSLVYVPTPPLKEITVPQGTATFPPNLGVWHNPGEHWGHLLPDFILPSRLGFRMSLILYHPAVSLFWGPFPFFCYSSPPSSGFSF